MLKSVKLGLISLFIAHLVLPFGCFSQREPTPDIHHDPIQEESSFSSVLPTQPSLELPDTPRADGYWDVSDVDISHIAPNRKLLALTFDDAPSSTLEEIVAVFLRHNEQHPDAPASATVFYNGGNIYPSSFPAIEAANTLGFEMGNHTHNHRNLAALTTAEIQREIDETDKLLQRFDGKERHLLRAPYGRLNDNVRASANAPIIDWFVDTADWTGVSAESIYNTVWENKGDGVIVLMHDGYPNTVDALKRLLGDLYEAGYQAVSVSQMAKAHGCHLKIGGVYTRARPRKQ